MGQINDLQHEHDDWVTHNFPDQPPYQPFMGIVEEVGELAHAHLKNEQGIRGMSDDEYHDAAQDALGDLFIYMMSYCNACGYDLESCITNAWEQVSQRDWKNFPKDGMTE